MSDGLKRIEEALREFSEQVSECRDNAKSTMADIRDAYARFNRLRERWEHEFKARSLDPTERAALYNVFEDDVFIRGMGKVRGISEHVVMDDAVLYHTDNSPFTITAASSAALVFSRRCVTLIDTKGNPHPWNHIKNLTEAERRITSAFEKAKGS
jgi:hypothetical protein